MAAISDYLENKILDHVLSGSTYSPPATVYFALFTSAPTDAGGGVEVSGTGYARAAVTNNLTNFPAAVGGSKSNGAVVNWPEAGGSWGTVVHFGIFDSLTGGNLLFHAALPASKVVGTGDQLKLNANGMTVTLD